MSDTAPALESLTARHAIDALVNMSVDELRRLAVRLDGEVRIVRTVLRERTRRPAGRQRQRVYSEQIRTRP